MARPFLESCEITSQTHTIFANGVKMCENQLTLPNYLQRFFRQLAPALPAHESTNYAGFHYSR